MTTDARKALDRMAAFIGWGHYLDEEKDFATLRAALDRAEALEKVAEAARWFSEHVYPPDVWLPEEVPDLPRYEDGGLDEGSRWAKRLNARLAALAAKGKP